MSSTSHFFEVFELLRKSFQDSYWDPTDVNVRRWLLAVEYVSFSACQSLLFSPPCHCWLCECPKSTGSLLPGQGKLRHFRWCIYFVVFLRENCVTEKITLESRICISIKMFHRAKNGTNINIYCPALTFHFHCVSEKKHFKCGVTGYCAARHLSTPSSLVPCISSVLNARRCSPSFRWEGEGREEWRTGKVTRGLGDKNQPDFYLGRAPGAGSSGLLLPGNQEKRDEGCGSADWFSS